MYSAHALYNHFVFFLLYSLHPSISFAHSHRTIHSSSSFFLHHHHHRHIHGTVLTRHMPLPQESAQESILPRILPDCHFGMPFWCSEVPINWNYSTRWKKKKKITKLIRSLIKTEPIRNYWIINLEHTYAKIFAPFPWCGKWLTRMKRIAKMDFSTRSCEMKKLSIFSAHFSDKRATVKKRYRKCPPCSIFLVLLLHYGNFQFLLICFFLFAFHFILNG